MTKGYCKWYENNREAFNAKRRQRYRADAAYRAAQQKSVTAWRDRKNKGTEPNEDGTYGMFAVASIIGKSVPTLRMWERQGYIPCRKNHTRRYTSENIDLILKLVDYLSHGKRRTPEFYNGLHQLVADIQREWVFYGD